MIRFAEASKFFVKTSGLRWISMMLLTPIPWAQRVWALPFLTVLAPSSRYHGQRKKRHKTITDWARQMIYQLRRWLPKRALVIVADSSYAVLDFLAKVVRLPDVCVVTRLRLDAALYDPAPERTTSTKGRPALKGKRRPSLAKRLADPKTEWQKLTVAWYGGVMREVEIVSLVTIFAHQLLGEQSFPVRQAAWYTKALPTFSDTLAFVRQLEFGESLAFKISTIDRAFCRHQNSGIYNQNRKQSSFFVSICADVDNKV